MIVAGEASGDLHGANLVRAMQARDTDLRFCGMGSRELAEAGVTILCDASKLAVVGITEVFSHLGDILRARRTLIKRMRSHRPDLLILIDYPDFNLWLASAAKKMAIPVLYYISPQVWAWRRGRVRKIKRLVDKMAVILPFEQEFYRHRGMEVDFVGHPLVDELTGIAGKPPLPLTANEQQVNGTASADTARQVIGLVPGSRRREIATLLPVFLAAARLLAQSRAKPPIFLLPMAPGLGRQTLEENGLDQYPELDIRISDQDRHTTMAACDAVMAASGTVTLELAILGVPTVATYRFSPLTYLIGRLLVNVPHGTLVNLVAGREVIPELIQDRAEPLAISREMADLLDNPTRRQTMLKDLAEVREKLGRGGASQKAADLAISLMKTP